MKFRYLLLSLTAAALVPVLTGCGSGGDEATAKATMPPQKFAHKADLICEDAGNEQAVKANLYLEQHPGTKEADLMVPAVIPPLEKEARELDELGLPKGQEEEAEVFLEEVKKALRALKEEPKSALSEKHSSYEKADQLGEQLGLGDCSRNP
jgi:hypothetical protein